MLPGYREEELSARSFWRERKPDKPNALTPQMACIELHGLQRRYERDRATHVYNEWHVLGFLLHEIFSLVYGLFQRVS
jgi:hypothetical protein